MTASQAVPTFNSMKAALVFALMCSPAFAGSPCTDPPVPWRFDKPLAQEPVVLDTFSPAEIYVLCQGAFHNLSAVHGCSDEVTNTIYLTSPQYLSDMGWTKVDIACLEKHERAHLWHEDGTRWPANHKGSVSR